MRMKLNKRCSQCKSMYLSAVEVDRNPTNWVCPACKRHQTKEKTPMNEKITTIDYENFKQVTTAGHVIETLRAEILTYKTMLDRPPEHGFCKVTLATRLQTLHSLLNSISLNELKMVAWQEMKGSEKIIGELYKQLSNGNLFEDDKLDQECCDGIENACNCSKCREQKTCQTCEKPYPECVCTHRDADLRLAECEDCGSDVVSCICGENESL